jgi:hypothetical protein
MYYIMRIESSNEGNFKVTLLDYFVDLVDAIDSCIDFARTYGTDQISILTEVPMVFSTEVNVVSLINRYL